MKKNFLLTLTFLVLFSCQQETFYEVSENIQTELTVVKTDSSFVSLDLAKRVASISNNNSSRSVSNAEGDIFTIIDKNNLPALYVVNNANKQGFSIVSATKNYHPVLAWSDKGYLNPELAPQAVDFYLSSFRDNVECLRNAPYDSICQYRQEWYDYEKNEKASTNVFSRSVSPDVQWFMDYSKIQWQNEGYEVTPLSSNEFGLPTSVYENAVFTAELFMREDFMETSFIVRKTEVETIKIPEMLNTRWNQDYPYNEVVLYQKGDYYTGCVAVALAQIMKYHKKPQEYNWDSMPTVADLSLNNYTGIAQLMYDIGGGVSMNYSANSSVARIDSARYYLNSVGYNNASLVSHNANTVKTQMLNRRPVYMSGLPANNVGVGHTWVCDGYEHNYGRTAYYLMTLDSQELAYYSNEIYFDSEWGSTYFHMNWGYGGDANGWYRDTDIAFNRYGETNNYSRNRQDIINIY